MTVALDPSKLGYYEKRPGSGIWSHPEKSTTFAPRQCENPGCQEWFMASRGDINRGRGRFCSHSCGRTAADPQYDARHARVYRVRGSASQFPCVDGCGRMALDWSQIHDTTGLDPEHYEPRCRKCHKRYDAETHSRGENHINATLTEAQVRGIHASVGATQRELAEIHGTTENNVGHIRRGETWKHITGGRAAAR